MGSSLEVSDMINEFLENLYEEVFYDEFYRELFPVGSFEEKGI